jgi:hypothetical protein
MLSESMGRRHTREMEGNYQRITRVFRILISATIFPARLFRGG